MMFPVTVRHRSARVKILGKSDGFPYYRVSFSVAGKRHRQTFANYAAAYKAAKAKAKELHTGSQAGAFTAKQSRDALAALERLDDLFRATGERFSLLGAVSDFVEARRKLGRRPLAEAVDGYLANVATLKRKDLAEAVTEFLAPRALKAQPEEGKRARLHPVYHRTIERILTAFAAAFPGHAVVDLTKPHLDTYMAAGANLAAKTRNDRRAAVKMFLRWAVRNDFLPANNRLFEADGMARETGDSATLDFYRPKELRALLEAAEGPLRALIALQGLAGLRLEEVCRLTWEDVFRVPGHVEVKALSAKTRQRRLVEIVPALAKWLQPCRGMTGKVWTLTPTVQGCITALQRHRETLKIPPRRNGLRHAFCTYHFALHANENLTAAQAGNSPAMIHAHYKGLATKKEAEAWFAVRPAGAANNILAYPQKANA